MKKKRYTGVHAHGVCKDFRMSTKGGICLLQLEHTSSEKEGDPMSPINFCFVPHIIFFIAVISLQNSLTSLLSVSQSCDVAQLQGMLCALHSSCRVHCFLRVVQCATV